MFGRLGGFAARYRWFVVAAWVVAAAVLTLVAPNIEDVAVNDQRAFLPDNNPSLDAITVMEREFPSRVSPSTAVVVVDAGEGEQIRDSGAWDLLDELTVWLSSADRPAAVDRILSPTATDEDTAAALVSKDGRVAMAVVDFSAVGTEEKTRTALDADPGPAGRHPRGHGGLPHRGRRRRLRLRPGHAKEPGVHHLDHHPAGHRHPVAGLPLAGQPAGPPGHHLARLPRLPGDRGLPG